MLMASPVALTSKTPGQRAGLQVEQWLTMHREKVIELAKLLLLQAQKEESPAEKRQQKLLALMIKNPETKALLSNITDSCFRTKDSTKVIDHLLFLLSTCKTIPSLRVFRSLARLFPKTSTRLIQVFLRYQMRQVIAPGESKGLHKRLKAWRKEGVRVNLNRLGEAILGEKEAEKRLNLYLNDLADPLVEVISVKISSICSQINLLAWEETLARLKERLRLLYRQSKAYPFARPDGSLSQKCINLDMEEYKDLELTATLFCQTLDEPEFLDLSAGIALQSYIPDSFAILQKITFWAISRKNRGGAPIKIRLVKGANLGMELVEASLKEWPQAPYKTKLESDANFKMMLQFAMEPAHVEAVKLGIGSHNLFDIAYAMLLAKENEVESGVCFEMLAGMAPQIRRAVSTIWPDVLLYCPVATKEEFHTAMAYLMRRLDENTAPENFLSHLFDLTVDSPTWKKQEELFHLSLLQSKNVSTHSRRAEVQNRKTLNEPDSDWSMAINRSIAKEISNKWQNAFHELPLVIGGKELFTKEKASGIDPSRPHTKIHSYCLASEQEIEKAIATAKSQAIQWAKMPLSEKVALFRKTADLIRSNRPAFIGAMLQESGKIIVEADSEVSETIDFLTYYAKQLEEHEINEMAYQTEKVAAAPAKNKMKPRNGAKDVSSRSKGSPGRGNAALGKDELAGTAEKVALVLTPWNFPTSIPCSAITSALACGYSVIFKPAPEAVLSGWLLASHFWQAGVPKEVLQFVTCVDSPMGWRLIEDQRIDISILTGATATARSFLKQRPLLRLFGETGGKNSLIVSSLSDRDQAVKDIITSAFGYAGQKCSACSLLILEEEVYHSKAFKEQLLDAASTLVWGSAWQPSTIVNPLIRPASSHLYKALTSLEEGEEWLLKPEQDSENPQLWSPGIKWAVKPGSFTHQTEFFGPLLAVMCAKDIPEAITFANATPYGLTAGLHSLNSREQELWKRGIQAGNCYINRGITGAIVGRQPFGGCKASSFGIGMKVGGPNYLLQLIDPIDDASLSYAYWWDTYFRREHEMRRLVGQDNLLRFVPKAPLFVLIQEGDDQGEITLLREASKICGSTAIFGTASELQDQIRRNSQCYVRALQTPISDFLEKISPHIACLDISKPSRNGRLELLHWVREVSISHDYHRYGSLMNRDQEIREPVL